MKIKENTTVYKCEYCGKIMFRINSMEKHEKYCYSNPNNSRACSGCVFLEEVEVKYSYSVPILGQNLGVIFDGGHVEKTTKGFYCKKLDKHLYPFKVEKLGLLDRYPESFEDKEPMPKTCEHLELFY